ncbi:MAG: carbon-nitrogen hydrolase family protein [Acidobacteriaceae bacterium]
MQNKKLTRRGFLGTAAGVGLGSLALPAFPVKLAAESEVVSESDLDRHNGNALSPGASGGCADHAEDWKSTSNRPPRKVIVGTVMQPFWGKYPGLEKRLQLLTELVDRLQEQSQKHYGRGLDLAVLPEMAVTGEGESVGDVVEWSFPLEGPVQEAFARKARQHHCYIVVPLFLLEDKATKLCSNAAVLVGREGEVAGIYRKVHLVVDERTDSMEHGCTPGKEEPIFACDFGKLGIQICYDIDFNYGWRELAHKGAEIVAWPTQSPQRTRPVARAIEGHYYIVSSTWRTDACVFEPTGKIVSQIEWKPSMGPVESVGDKPLADNILVQEIDLSYAIVGWSPTLENGKLFTKTFGDKAGFRYYDDDDRGIFWSNDPKMTVRQMIDRLGLTEEQEQLQHAREVYHKAGVPGY